MITAKDARVLCEDMATPRNKEIVEIINQTIRECAIKGERSVNIARYQPTDSMLLYFESLGYKCTTKKNEYGVYIVFTLHW